VLRVEEILNECEIIVMSKISRPNGGANPRSAVDAGFVLCLDFERRWSGATDSEC
jgi:hypothetical protein